MTREQFEEKKATMRASGLGTLYESWHPDVPGRRAYLYAYLGAEVDAEAAPQVVSDWMKLAIEVNGYFTVNTYSHMPCVNMRIAVSYDLP